MLQTKESLYAQRRQYGKKIAELSVLLLYGENLKKEAEFELNHYQSEFYDKERCDRLELILDKLKTGIVKTCVGISDNKFKIEMVDICLARLENGLETEIDLETVGKS